MPMSFRLLLMICDSLSRTGVTEVRKVIEIFWPSLARMPSDPFFQPAWSSRSFAAFGSNFQGAPSQIVGMTVFVATPAVP